MECMDEIKGPESIKSNLEISNICYVNPCNTIVIGTDIGKIYFWDISRSQYIKIDNELYRSKSYITCIIHGTSLKGKEYAFSCCKL